MATLASYRLKFGNNKNLEITESQKVVEAHLHNKGNRVTLIYKGLGSFTFNLKKAKSIVEPSTWNGVYLDVRDYKVQLGYDPKTHIIEGKGVDENEIPVTVSVALQKEDVYNWTGHYETDTSTQTLLI